MELINKINILRISYILQIILLIIFIILNSVYKNKLDWMNQILTICFYFLFICLIIISIFVFIFFIIIFFKKNYSFFLILLKLSTSLFVSRLIISIALFIIYLIEINDLKTFYEYCPFNFDLNDLIILFPNLNDNSHISNNNIEIKNKCISRRCIEYNNNGKKYSFICNFNSTKKENEENIICYKNIFFNIKETIPEIMLSYINLCINYIEIYKCDTNKKPKEFSIESNYRCPQDKNKSLFLDIILMIFNLIFPIFIYILQFIYYKKILKLIVTQEIQRHNDTNVNKTIDSSKKIDNNKSNKSIKSFKKEKTEIIIVDNNENYNEQNIMQIIDKNKETNRKKSIKIFKKDLFPKIKIKKNFENKKKINSKNINNKSFTKNTIDFNSKENNFEFNSVRLLTEVNQIKNDEFEKRKKDKDKIKYIIIKK